MPRRQGEHDRTRRTRPGRARRGYPGQGNRLLTAQVAGDLFGQLDERRPAAIQPGPRSSRSTVPCGRARSRKGTAAISRPGPPSRRASPAAPGGEPGAADQAPPATVVPEQGVLGKEGAILAGVPASAGKRARARPCPSAYERDPAAALIFRYRQTPPGGAKRGGIQ